MLLVTLNGLKLLSPRVITKIENKHDDVLKPRKARRRTKDGKQYENLKVLGAGGFTSETETESDIESGDELV